MKKEPIFWVLLVCLTISSGLTALYFINFKGTGLSQETNVWGTFGDYIGGIIGSIFNFTGVILIYLTFRKQHENHTLELFENTFFNMLNTQRDIVRTLRGTEISRDPQSPYGVKEKELEGYYFIKTLSIHLRVKIDQLDTTLSSDKLQNEIGNIYNPVFTANSSALSHYFRHLYHLVKFIHESDINNKKKYIDIIQAQMSDNELYLNFYNGISNKGKLKFSPLLDQYRFFENIMTRGEAFDYHAKTFYPSTVFKNAAN